MQKDAIQTKQKRLAAQEALQKQQAQDEVAKAQAESNERLKQEDANRQQQSVDLEKKQQLQAIKDAEVEARKQKALTYLASSDGKDLVQQIKEQFKQFHAQQEKEGAYVNSLQELVNTLMKRLYDPSLSALDRDALNERLKQATGDWIKAGQEYKDSPELEKMRKDLLARLDNFKQSSGMSWDDAKKLPQDTLK
jgi:hypothetical protein